MSKFLKFIVNVFLLFAILVAAAILVPPLTGVTTTIVDSASMDTNLPLGSITYSTDIEVGDLQPGDEVLKENNSSTYSYVIKSGNASSGKFKVVSSTNPDGKEEEITLRNTVSKVAVVVPYIGYVMIAMHSTEGIIIVALVVVLMIILFILSELWKARSEDEEEEDEDEEELPETEGRNVAADGTPLPFNEIVYSDDIPEINPDIRMDDDSDMKLVTDREEEDDDVTIATPVPAREEEETVVELSATPEPEEPMAVPEMQPIDEVEEIDPVLVNAPEAEEEAEAVSSIIMETTPIETEASQEVVLPVGPKADEAEASEPEFDFADAIFAATEEVEAEEEKRAEEAAASVEATQVILPNPEQLQSEAEPEADELPEQFIPVERPTLDELMDQAKKAGDEPVVRRDDATDVTLVDYSEIL